MKAKHTFMLIPVNDMNHVAYADEAYYNTGRYHSIALVSLKHADAVQLRNELEVLLELACVKEFKWKKFRGARERFAASDLLSWAINKANKRLLRIDVLTWDTEDERHKILLRDDIANMHVMYYQLFKNVMCERWPNESVWRLYPDEHTAMRWDKTKAFLSRTGTRTLKQNFKIEQIIPCQSHMEPFVQLADLFAGLASYSRISYDQYSRWKQTIGHKSIDLTERNVLPELFSKKERERFRVLAEFDTRCKGQKMGVSLQSSRGLRTFDPLKPINFWLYIPQHESDRAPVKSIQYIIKS